MKEQARKARIVMNRWAPVRILGDLGVYMHRFFKMFVVGGFLCRFFALSISRPFAYLYWSGEAGKGGGLKSKAFEEFCTRHHVLEFSIFGKSGSVKASPEEITELTFIAIFLALAALFLFLDLLMYACNRLWDIRFKKLVMDTAEDGIMLDDWAGERILKKCDLKDREAIGNIRRTNENLRKGWTENIR